MEINDISMNAELEDTTPTVPEQNEGTTAENPEDTAPQDQQDSNGTAVTDQQESGAAVEETIATEEPFLVIQHNHENINLTREEAITLAQQGKHYKGLHDKLDFLAVQSNTDVNGLVNALIKQQEDNYRQSLVDKLGEDSDLIDGLMKVYRDERKEKYEKTVADRTTQTETKLTTRLAGEYEELKKRIPTVPAFIDLPDTVKKDAAEGMSLLAAFLLHQHNEASKQAAAQQSAQKATNASTGSMSSDADTKTSDEEQYLAGLWGK